MSDELRDSIAQRQLLILCFGLSMIVVGALGLTILYIGAPDWASGFERSRIIIILLQRE